MRTKRVNVRLPEELVEKADVAAEVTHRNRTEVLIEALRSYFGEVEDDSAFKEAVVELYLDDEIDFETLAAFVGRRDAESVRASKEMLDRGDATADEIANRRSWLGAPIYRRARDLFRE